MERGNRLLGHVLTPVGLAVISISLVAATRLYGLIPVEVGLGVALLSAIAAAVIAVRAGSQIVAAFGLVAVLLAPPLMGASPDLSTLAFVAVVLIGTTGVALWRSWSWLPPTAFVLAAPQAASWVTGDPEPAIGLLGLGLFWLLNIVAAGGEAFRRRRDDVSASSATLLLANVAFFIWAGFVLLSGELEVYRGFFLVYLALAQIGVGGYFVVRDGERNLFGLLAIGTGIAALTMAAPIQSARPSCQLPGPPKPSPSPGLPFGGVIRTAPRSPGSCMCWRAWPPRTCTTRRSNRHRRAVHRRTGRVARLPCCGDRPRRVDRPRPNPPHDAGRVRADRGGHLRPGRARRAWDNDCLVDPDGHGRERLANRPALPADPIAWQVEGLIPRALQRIGDWRSPADQILPITTALLGIAATWWIVVPVYAFGAGTAGARVPFVDPAGGALAVYLVALGAVGWIAVNRRLREGLAALGLLVTAWASAIEFEGVALVGAWSALIVVGFALERGLATLAPGRRARRLEGSAFAGSWITASP